MRKWPVFICYRQSDGRRTAQWIYDILKGQPVQLPAQKDLAAELATLDVYFDLAAPGVGDWTAIHEPYLKRARAFVVICTPGAKINEGETDWVHKEIGWWLANRETAPVLIDPLGEQDRYVPSTIAAKWPNAQRIEVSEGEWEELEGRELELLEGRTRARILAGIVPSAENIYRQELEQEQKRAGELQAALIGQKALSRKLKGALAAAAAMLVVAVGTSIYAYVQKGRADQRAIDADKQTEKVKALLPHQARAQALRSQLATNSGDAVTGILHALDALPESPQDSERPYVAEAEKALYAGIHGQREIEVQIAGAVAIPASGSLPRGVEGPALAVARRTRIIEVREHTATIRDLVTGKSIPLADARGVMKAAIGHDGKRAATGSLDGVAQIWDAETGRLLTQVGHDKLSVNGVAFSPDGARLATASADQTARIWDVKTGARLKTLEGHESALLDVAFSPDGRRVATASSDRTARVWDAETQKMIAELRGHAGPVQSVAWSAAERVVTVSDDGTIRHWDLSVGPEIRLLAGHGDIVGGAAISPDAKLAATASWDNSSRIWNTETGSAARVLRDHTDDVNSAEFSRDGTLLVTSSSDGTARIWNALDGTPKAVLRGHTARVSAAAFNSAGTHVVSASDDSTARIWDVQTGAAVVLPAHRGRVFSASFNSDGTRILTAGDDGVGRIWDAASGRVLRPLEGHEGRILSASFSRDGAMVITAATDGTARLWNSGTGVTMQVLRGHSGFVLRGNFNADGTRTLTVSDDGTARIWDTSSGRALLVLKGHGQMLTRGFFLPGRRSRVLTAGYDNTARIWDGVTGGEIAVLKGHSGPLWDAAVDRNGTLAITASADRTARLWRIFPDTQALVEHARKVVSRCLTPEQRREVSVRVEPPRWCIEMGKWPYHTAEWKQWLARSDAGERPSLPNGN